MVSICMLSIELNELLPKFLCLFDGTDYASWKHEHLSNFVVVVHSLSHVQLFATPWTTACQAPLSFTISQRLSDSCPLVVMPSNHLILYHPLLLPSIFPSIRVFPVSQLFASSGQSIGALASASVLPMNIQGWFPLGLTGLICLLSKELSGVFSTNIIWKHQFFGTQPSLWSSSHIHIWSLEKT